MRRLISILIILMCFATVCPAPDIWIDVDTSIVVPVNIYPLVDVDGVIDTGVLYNDAGISVVWNFSTTAGVFTSVAVTPTTAGFHDWAEGAADKGMYSLEIPATGGTINNNTEGTGWFTGDCTATIPWRGPTIGFRAAATNNAMIDGSSLVTDIWAIAMVDLAAGAPSATASALTAINYLYEALRNKIITTDAGEVQIYKDDGSTILMESDVSDDDIDFTKGEYGAED